MQTLRSLLAAKEFVVAPGVYEMFSARIADRMEFKALYMTGYGVSVSHLGLADAGLVTYRDMVERARTIASGITKPLIADADTGFGGLINISRRCAATKPPACKPCRSKTRRCRRNAAIRPTGA